MGRGLDSSGLHLRRIAAMPRSTGPRGVPLAIYQHLLEINAGFEQVRVALAALDQSAMFDRGELKRFSALSAEARAALASRSEEHTSELQSLRHLVCRLLLEKNN